MIISFLILLVNLMNGMLTTDFTIEKTISGFIIFLLSGSWDEPYDIKVNAPKDMNTQDQAKCLRLGLKFASEFMIVSPQIKETF